MTPRQKAIEEGKNKYIGSPCSSNHDPIRYTKSCSCVECSRLNRVKVLHQRRVEREKNAIKPYSDLHKICSTCKVDKLRIEFYKHKYSTDGLASQCKECFSATTAIYRSKNKSRKAEIGKKYYESNKRRISLVSKTWVANNPERSKAIKDRWWKSNKGKVNAQTAKRHATKITQTPPWANLDIIEQIYIDCTLMSKMTLVKHHVDHIIPLRGKLVSGLHVETNLRIIPALENINKSNKLIEELL